MIALIAALSVASASQALAGASLSAMAEPGHFRVNAYGPDDARAVAGASVFVRVRKVNGETVIARAVRTTAVNVPAHVAQDFFVDVSVLSPGVYALTVSVPAGAFTSGHLLGAPAAVDPIRFYVPQTTAAAPRMRVGQRYLYLPAADNVYFYAGPRDVAQFDPPIHDQALHELIVSAVMPTDSKTTLLFRDIGSGSTRRMTVTSSTWAPVKLEVEDETLARLRAKYEGKLVWHYAGGWASCPWSDPDEATSPGIDAQPVRIKRIVRVYGAAYSLPLGVMQGAMTNTLLDREGGFVSWTPLVVFPELREPLSGRDPMTGRPWRCVAPYYTMFSDRWDFERVFSLTPPPRPSSEMHVGMTKDDVLWSIGFPLVYGTRADVLALDTWRYEHLPPFHYWVYFQHGKVVKFGEDGNP